MAAILIVDDDAGLREALAEAIGDLGHEPRMAATGREALVHLDAHPVDAVLLDLGETGNRKEFVARRHYQPGPPKTKPFVGVNFAAIPSELLESELFGHVKGGFTGAGGDCQGAFRDADGGTLFLDEVGD